MSGAARSLYAWSIYVAAIGVGFLLMPNAVLSVFQIDETDEVWIRIVGLFVLGLAFLYIAISRSGRAEMYLATVWYRWFIAAGLVVLGLTEGPWQLILFATVDVLGGLWTYLSVRTEKTTDA